MKVTEQYFPMVLFIMLFKVLTFESVGESSVTIQMKAIESVDGLCDHSNETFLWCCLLNYFLALYEFWIFNACFTQITSSKIERSIGFD